MTTESSEKTAGPKAAVGKLHEVAKRSGYDKMSDGSWFQRLVGSHIKKHAAQIDASHWDRRYPGLDAEARADEEIRKTVFRAVTAGAVASAGASVGELLSLVTDGLAAPIGVPAALVSMLGEAAYTARLQIDLACDLASIYGAPFDPDDGGEVATLFGLALEVDMRKKPEEEEEPDDPDTTSSITEKLMALEDGELAKRIGRKLLEDAVMRNIVPLVGLGISARWNYVATRKFALNAKKYARYRRALRRACARLKVADVADPALLLEGAWLLATVDGEIEHDELLALALILEALPITETDLRLEDKPEDEEEWFERLKKAPCSLYDPLLDVLYLVAATDQQIVPSERRFLTRLGKAIGRDIDQKRLDQIARHLAKGKELPEGFLNRS